MTAEPQLTKEEQDILDFLILPSEFELCQTIAMEALDKIVASHTPAKSEQEMWATDEITEHEKYAADAGREKILIGLDKEIAVREYEMNRKAGLEDNMTTATGYYTAAGALNWVRKMIEELRSKQGGEQE